jgi:hypothetical protein
MMGMRITPSQAAEVKRLIQIYSDATRNAAEALGRYGTDGTADQMALEKHEHALAALKAIRAIYGLETPAEPTQINAALPGGFDIK